MSDSDCNCEKALLAKVGRDLAVIFGCGLVYWCNGRFKNAIDELTKLYCEKEALNINSRIYWYHFNNRNGSNSQFPTDS